MKCYVGAMAPELLPGLKAAAGSPIIIMLEDDAEKDNVTQVFNILALSTSKGARNIVRERSRTRAHSRRTGDS